MYYAHPLSLQVYPAEIRIPTGTALHVFPLIGEQEKRSNGNIIKTKFHFSFSTY